MYFLHVNDGIKALVIFCVFQMELVNPCHAPVGKNLLGYKFHADHLI